MTYHHGDLKQAILTAGLAVLKHDKALSLRGLAKEVGVSPAAVYRHFANKNQLMAALAEQGFEQLAQMFHDIKAADPLEHLLILGETYVNFALRYPVHYEIMFGQHAWHEQQEEGGETLNTTCETTFQTLVDVCSELTRDKPETTMILVAAVWSQAHGFALLNIRNQLKSLPQTVTVREMFELTWRKLI